VVVTIPFSPLLALFFSCINAVPRTITVIFLCPLPPSSSKDCEPRSCLRLYEGFFCRGVYLNPFLFSLSRTETFGRRAAPFGPIYFSVIPSCLVEVRIWFFRFPESGLWCSIFIYAFPLKTFPERTSSPTFQQRILGTDLRFAGPSLAPVVRTTLSLLTPLYPRFLTLVLSLLPRYHF